jgi:hypothetical protein
MFTPVRNPPFISRFAQRLYMIVLVKGFEHLLAAGACGVLGPPADVQRIFSTTRLYSLSLLLSSCSDAGAEGKSRGVRVATVPRTPQIGLSDSGRKTE